ncbi:MAG: APC family permease [Deltaproteobacteria bacterium]|nr:APC family permease [Deltaproteobacteria bacterium]
MDDSGKPRAGEEWDFAGWGTATRISNLDTAGLAVSRLDQPRRHTLGTWSSTAICGNDITSSCLYVSALCAAQAGVYAPVALLLVAVVLFLFRKVYAEVGSALPLNGGTYTVLLNTTNKSMAAGAACLTLLSYIATAVISAGEAMHYAHNLWPRLDVFWATLGLLSLFAGLNIVGISESAVVALGIFVAHLATLTVLCATGALVVAQDPSLLAANWAVPSSRGLSHALFFGFAAAMLGISGFESSANFIEEQKSGVFPKTLRNMWIAVTIFNPLISLLSLGLLPLGEIEQVPPDLLARMGEHSAGPWLRYAVSVDAVLVLSGAVLTSFVGVTGLVRRMGLDRCLPQFLLRENRWRGTNHWIILLFLGVCCAILATTRGQVSLLAGVYTLSFLSVMALFAVGNLLLKVRRARLPRDHRASWTTVIVALGAVLLGLLGNVLLDPAYVRVFLVYFVAVGAAVAVMFLRLHLLRAVLFAVRSVSEKVLATSRWVQESVRAKMDEINARAVVYFAKGDDPAELNRAALYVLQNEQTNRLQVVFVYAREEEVPPALADHLREIDRLYPRLRIDFVTVHGVFGPELIEALSRSLGVPKNYMFIGTPGDHFPHRIEDLGGVRLILG